MNLLEARTYVRTLLAEDSPAFWSNAQLNVFIQRSFLSVYTQIAQSGRGYFETTGLISYVAGQELYSLAAMAPSGFVKLCLVERIDIPPNCTILPIDLSEKNDYALDSATETQGYERYFMSGNNIGIAPPPVSSIANVLRLWHVPVPALPSADGDTFPADLTDLHHECIAQGAFMRAAQRDKQLLALVAPVYKDLMELVKADTQQRISQEPRRIIDTDKNWS
jgi:hypothetical protein